MRGKVQWDLLDWDERDEALAAHARMTTARIARSREAYGWPLATKDEDPGVEWDEVENWGERTNEEIAEAIGCSLVHVRRYRFVKGLPREPYRHPEPWNQVEDWANRSNKDIADQVGVSPQLVGKYRRDHGLPRPRAKPKSPPRDPKPKIPWGIIIGWEYRSDANIAKELGCTRQAVWTYRRKHNLPSPKAQSRFAWHTITDWEHRSNSAIALQLGCARRTVAEHRKKAGLPPAPGSREGRRRMGHDEK